MLDTVYHANQNPRKWAFLLLEIGSMFSQEKLEKE